MLVLGCAEKAELSQVQTNRNAKRRANGNTYCHGPAGRTERGADTDANSGKGRDRWVFLHTDRCAMGAMLWKENYTIGDTYAERVTA